MSDRSKRVLTLAIVTACGLLPGCDSSPSPSSGDVSVAVGGGVSEEAKAKAKPPAATGKKGGGAPIMPGR